MKRLMLVNKMICIQIFECNLAQKLNFSWIQWNFFIYTNDVAVVNVYDMQSKELLI